MLTPAKGHVLAKEIEEDSGVVTTSEMSDTKQHFLVLAVGAQDKKETRQIKPGDKIYVQKHADADVPNKLKEQGLYLLREDRILGYER